MDVKFCGKSVTDKELKLILELSKDFWGISRCELANTVCELLGWIRPSGRLKTVECVQFLEKLELRSFLRLPKLRQGKPKGTKSRTKRTSLGEEGSALIGSVKEVKPVTLLMVTQTKDREIWKELVDRYHYLGYKVPFGACLRYLIEVRHPEKQLVGCLQFSSPAWRVKARDGWIGWEPATREKNLQKIVQNSRFLILPWCKVRGLASHVLSLAARQIGQSWEKAFKVSPVLLETFVDLSRYKGTCYRAANWVHLGETQGRGRMDRENEYGEPVKSLWVYPLAKDFKQVLCSKGRGIERMERIQR
jgi:hypothetical protein